jgi:hypothetical protein
VRVLGDLGAAAGRVHHDGVGAGVEFGRPCIKVMADPFARLVGRTQVLVDRAAAAGRGGAYRLDPELVEDTRGMRVDGRDKGGLYAPLEQDHATCSRVRRSRPGCPTGGRHVVAQHRRDQRPERAAQREQRCE